MPLYSYACICGYSTEYLVKIDHRDSIQILCPVCGERLHRVFSVVNLGKPKHKTQLIMRNGRKVSGTWEK